MLLVNNKEETLNYLRNMGINTSEWQDGLTGLLYNVNLFLLNQPTLIVNLHRVLPRLGVTFKATQHRGTTTTPMEETGRDPPAADLTTALTDTRQTHDRSHTKSRPGDIS